MALDLATGFDRFEQLASRDHYLAMLVTQGDDLGPQVSVVNAGLVNHPQRGDRVVALVARGNTEKLRNVRARAHATLVFRAGWEWVAVAGPVELVGPDDRVQGIDGAALRQLLRDIYHAAGGHHPDLDEYDTAMAADRRTAVLVTAHRIWTNPPGTDHKEPVDS